MKHSKYNYIVSNGENHIVFNGLNCTCVTLDKESFEHFQNFTSSADDTRELTRLGFFVDDTIDETEKFLYRSRLIDYKKASAGYRVLTTLDCNAKCAYCYEHGFKKLPMSTETADAVADFLIKKSLGLKHLTIQWFGGEPLFNLPVINQITDKVKPVLDEKHIKFTSTMVSNGFLFSDALIKQAKEHWRLQNVQITLDGPKEIHEKVKQFNVKDAFDCVIANIHKLASSGIHVSVRMNYDDENFSDIIKLITFLAEEFPNRQNLHFYTYRLFAAKKNSTADVELLKHFNDCGFEKDLIRSINTHTTGCMARSINGGTIMPDGKIAKCCRGSNLPNGIVGSVFDEDYNENIYSWCAPRLPNECYECKYLPLCNGGCAYERFKSENPCFINDDMINFILSETLRKQKETNGYE